MRHVAFLLATAVLGIACSTKTNPNNDGGVGVTCASDISVGWSNYALCAAGTAGSLGTACPAITPPPMCIDTHPIAACCAWVQEPKTDLARAPSSLHYYGQPSGQPTVDVSCTDTPPTAGTSQMVTLTGYVKVFLGQDADSAGVKVEIFHEGTNGALGALIGAAVVTDSNTSATDTPRPNTWLANCPTAGCTERQFTYPNVPTETPLIIHTSDALAANKWASFYDYNVYFANSAISTTTKCYGNTAPCVMYDTTGVGTTDILTVTATVGLTPTSGKGLLAGEVHDCGDVRLQNAEVNTDYRPQGDIFYFGSDETQPLPDKTATATSQLGLFGAVNYPINVPIHISAVGKVGGTRKLIGAYTVQVFDGAVTALSLRGRRPYQHD
jgi:hypothetical protein